MQIVSAWIEIELEVGQTWIRSWAVLSIEMELLIVA